MNPKEALETVRKRTLAPHTVSAKHFRCGNCGVEIEIVHIGKRDLAAIKAMGIGEKR